MGTDVVVALIAIVSGGSATAFLNVLLTHTKLRHESHEKDIDERIAAWQKISDRNEERIGELERKLDGCSERMKCLERYILALEQIIVRAGPPLELPPWPQCSTEMGKREKRARSTKGKQGGDDDVE